MNFCELIAPPVGTARTQSYFDERNIQIIANKEEEIKELVQEMLEKGMGRLTYSDEDDILQRKYQEMAADCGKLYGDIPLVSNGRIGRNFLRRYASLLSSDAVQESESTIEM